ncbi:MAG: VacJ family lipoprotein [Rickettsiaceae bacterium]|nr:VacJ family lipoprotein [Rickettsiaceae bacterium]
MSKIMKFASSTLAVFSLLLFQHSDALASSKYNYSIDSDDSCADLDDPFEKVNRKIFIFNSVLDHFLLRPIARGYRELVSDYARDKVSNFVDNFSVPLTTVNTVLQADAKNASQSLWQFLINSTLGIGGFFDVAAGFGVEKPAPQTFGSTLARYGVGPGPYVVLPFYGSSNVRDMFDPIVFNSKLNPLKRPLHRDFSYALAGVSLVQKRSEVLDFTDYVAKRSPDPYVTIRTTFQQNRHKSLRYPAGYRCKRMALK